MLSSYRYLEFEIIFIKNRNNNESIIINYEYWGVFGSFLG